MKNKRATLQNGEIRVYSHKLFKTYVPIRSDERKYEEKV